MAVGPRRFRQLSLHFHRHLLGGKGRTTSADARIATGRRLVSGIPGRRLHDCRFQRLRRHGILSRQDGPLQFGCVSPSSFFVPFLFFFTIPLSFLSGAQGMQRMQLHTRVRILFHGGRRPGRFPGLLSPFQREQHVSVRLRAVLQSIQCGIDPVPLLLLGNVISIDPFFFSGRIHK